MNGIVPLTTSPGLPARAPDDVIAAYVAYRGIPRDVVLYGTSKLPQDVWPRHELAFLLSRLTRLSNLQIGLLFGGRDHTIVANSLTRMEGRLDSDRAYASEYRAMEAAAAQFVPQGVDAICTIATRALRGVATASDIGAMATTIMAISSIVQSRALTSDEALAATAMMLQRAPGVGHV